MLNLTRQEQYVIVVVVLLLFFGLTVKLYRTATAADTVTADSKK